MASQGLVPCREAAKDLCWKFHSQRVALRAGGGNLEGVVHFPQVVRGHLQPLAGFETEPGQEEAHSQALGRARN
eukprot:6501238-Lingulodinium_polyedra.AAC.1